MSITKHYSSYFNLVGETLFHKSWGKGIVEAFDNSKLIVCFENTEYGKKVATFQFPDAFSNFINSNGRGNNGNILKQTIFYQCIQTKLRIFTDNASYIFS